MAKAKSKTNRSQMIRDILAINPHMPAKEVVAEIAAKGHKITEALVYFVKGKMKAGKQRKTRVAKAATAATSNGKATKVDAITMIREVKTLAKKAGGYSKLKELVDALSE